MEASQLEEKIPVLSLLQRVRNMWEFASIMQFIFVFGKAVKIDEDFDIEVWPATPTSPDRYGLLYTLRGNFDARNR